MNKPKYFCLIFVFVIFLCSSCKAENSEADYTPVSSSAEFSKSVQLDDNEKSDSLPANEFENESALYDDNTVVSVDTPLLINEAVVSSYGISYDENNSNYDWVELKNISSDYVNLSSFYLSDDKNNLCKYNLPDKVLSPGELYILICDDEDYITYPSTGFSLDAEKEELYLSDGSLVYDYILLENVPLGGSCGREDDSKELFYFSSSSFMCENTDGKLFISSTPVSDTPDGVYNDVESIEVGLTGKGKIYYTLDGSAPDESSTLYTEKITVTSTCVIRAVSYEDGGAPSDILTLSYIINEGYSLPVVSVVTDSPWFFEDIYDCGTKTKEQPGCISLYDSDGGFKLDCGVSMSGQTSLKLSSKKSLKIQFRSAYGSSKLKYDLFGEGEQTFKSICLRAGQDSEYRNCNTDIWQDLALEMSDSIITQHSKPCILYINGEYYGIYSIKENVSKDFYAQAMDVSSDSVSQCDIPADFDEEFKADVYDFIMTNDMSLAENYEHICSLVDIDNFIDWCIVEGVSANEDLSYNVKAFRSSEGDGKWRFVLYDLDGAFKHFPNPWSTIFADQIYGFPNLYLKNIVTSLFKNAEFKDAFLKRYSQVYSTSLSNDNIAKMVEKYRALLEPDMKRDRARWYYTLDGWNSALDVITKKVYSSNWQNLGVKNLCSNYLSMSTDEILSYFPDYNPE